MEEGHISCVNSYGQAVKQECCFPHVLSPSLLLHVYTIVINQHSPDGARCAEVLWVPFVSDIAIFVLKRDVKLQPTYECLLLMLVKLRDDITKWFTCKRRHEELSVQRTVRRCVRASATSWLVEWTAQYCIWYCSGDTTDRPAACVRHRRKVQLSAASCRWSAEDINTNTFTQTHAWISTNQSIIGLLKRLTNRSRWQ